eukprot:TRINITY_DN5728_c0_g1_i1.p1 TRINITY_DN5728_c0_g1~~TRINITY_DN5728_c0_g1_i1.p1  ORF type:complete len:1195 (-),score=255.42 TRINITY_DN5728_c0_g1_i1:350-3466(-)
MAQQKSVMDDVLTRLRQYNSVLPEYTAQVTAPVRTMPSIAPQQLSTQDVFSRFRQFNMIPPGFVQPASMRPVPPAAPMIVPRQVPTLTKEQLAARDELQLKQRMQAHEQRLRKEERLRFCRRVVDHSEQFHKFHDAHKKQLAKVHMAFYKWLERKEKERKQKEAQRMKALKEKDEGAYLRLVAEAKNERLTNLLEQTDQFLRRIGAKVLQAKEAQKDESAEAAEKALLEAQKLDASAAEADDQGTGWVQNVLSNHRQYYSIAHAIQEQVKEQPKNLQGGQLRPFQMDGLRWLVSLYNNNLNGILADEMGLGKTIQTISLLAYLAETKNQPGPHLIIVPLSTMSNWTKEFATWLPSFKVIAYRGSVPARTLLAAEMKKGFNVCITTYDFVMKDAKKLGRMKWTYLVMDEAQRIKNHKCKLASLLSSKFHTKHRLLLSGTPLQNNLTELWSLLNFLLPTVFDSSDSFDQWFNAPFAGDVTINEEEKLLIILRLHQTLRPFLLRRLKKEVATQLPDKQELILKCDMSAWQRSLYKEIQSGGAGLMNKIMQLRKTCNHPYLFYDYSSFPIDNDLLRASGKFMMLQQVIPKLLAVNHRILIFCQMTQLMDVMAKMFELNRWQFLRLDGSSPADERARLVSVFNAPDGPSLFMLSTRAGGLGLNLQSADTVIIFDSDWNPQMDLQAQDRAHRIGQTREVRIYRLITCTPVEEEIMRRANVKLSMDAMVIQAGGFNDAKADSAERSTILEHLLKADLGDNNDSDDVPDVAELNQILSQTEEDTRVFEQMDADLPPLPALFVEEEATPLWRLREDKPVTTSDLGIMIHYGRGRRERNDVSYAPKDYREELGDSSEDEYDDEAEAQRNHKRPREETPLPMTDNTPPRGTPPRTVATPPRGTPPRGTPPRHTPPRAPDDMTPLQRGLLTMWRNLKKATDTDGHPIAVMFNELPNSQLYPDYYQLIRRPLCLQQVLQKIKVGYYPTVQAFVDDIQLIRDNAFVYNQEGSQVCYDAECLRRLCGKLAAETIMKIESDAYDEERAKRVRTM